MKTLRMIRDSSALVSPSDTNSNHNNNNHSHHQNLFDTIYLTPTTTTHGYKHDDPTNTPTMKREHEQMMMMRNDDPMNNDRSGGHHQHHHHRMDAWERRQIAQKITRNTMFSLFDKMEHSNWFQALQRKINSNTMSNNNNRYSSSSSSQQSSYHNPYAAYSRQEQLIRSLVDRWLQFKDQFGNTRRKIGELASVGGAKREREEGDDRAAARDIADRIDQYLFREKRRREHNQRTKRNVSLPNQSFQQQQQLQLQQQQQSQGYYGNMRRFGFWKRIRKSYQWFINCVFESLLWVFKLLFRQFLKT